MTTDYKEILYTVDGPVATITMNRPDQLNALTSLTQAEIRHGIRQPTLRTGDVRHPRPGLHQNHGWHFGADVIDDDEASGIQAPQQRVG